MIAKMKPFSTLKNSVSPINKRNFGNLVNSQEKGGMEFLCHQLRL